MPNRKKDRLPLAPPVAAVLVLSALGWAASYAYTVVNADVTMPDWSVTLLNFAAELLSALRTAVMLAAAARFRYAGESVLRTAVIPLVCIAGNALLGVGATWLAQGFGELNPLTVAWELLLTAAAFVIALAMRKKYRAARSVHARQTWGAVRAAAVCALPAAVLPLCYAALDLADQAGDRSGAVYFTGVLVRRVLIYVVLAPAAAGFAAELFGKNADK